MNEVSSTCAIEDENAAIIAPAGFDPDHKRRLGLLIDETRPSAIEVDGPTPSGMFRLRVANQDLCGELNTFIEKLRLSAKKAGIDVRYLGADPPLPPPPVITPVPTPTEGKGVPPIFGEQFKRLGIVEAWWRTRGDPRVIVAIVDSGMNLGHALLKPRLWQNRKEIHGVPNKDDDGHGVADDMHGADFASTPQHGIGYVNTPGEDHDHGTSVGFVAGGNSFSSLYSGVAPGITLLPVKFIGPDGFKDFNLGRAIEYAADVGASIANVSCVHRGALPATQRAIEFAQTKEMLVVCSAGNPKGDLATLALSPAAINLQPSPPGNLVAVMSVAPSGIGRQAYSRVAVDIAAPNMALVPPSTGTNPVIGSDSSIAAPYFSGIAALVKSLNPAWWTFERIREHLMESGSALPDLKTKNRSGMIVNAKYAVLGPIRITPPLQGIVWGILDNPVLHWTLRFQSKYCDGIAVEFQADGTATWVQIGGGRSAHLQATLDLSRLARSTGKVRVRSIDSEFHSAEVLVTIV